MVKCWITLSILIVSLAPPAWGADWQFADKIDLAPRSTLVVLVQQQGVDLAVRVRAVSGPALEQDGPDLGFGAEVLLLENPTPQAARYDISVRTVFNGEGPAFQLQRIVNPTPAEIGAARALSAANQQWRVQPSADTALPLVERAVALEPGRLREIALNANVDVLARSGRSAEVIELLQRRANAADGATPMVDRIYRQYQLASAHWGALQADAALATIDAVAHEVDASPQWRSAGTAPVRRWLELTVDTARGAIRVFAGRVRGDRKLMQQGGDLLASTLRPIANSREYALRAQLTEYLAGYYNFIFDRSSNVTAELYRQAAELYERASDRIGLAAIRNNQAYAELGRGNVESALQLYLETLQLQQRSPHLEGQAYVRARLGYLYYTIGDYRRGEIRFRESIDIYKRLKLSLKLIHNQLQLAELLQSDERPREALALLDELYATNGPSLSVEDRLRYATRIALLRLDQGDVPGAERAVAQLGDLARFDSKHWSALQVSVRLFYLLDFEIARAKIEYAHGERLVSEKRVEQALNWLGESKREPLQQLELLRLQLELLEQRGDEERFAQTGARALALIETVRGSIDFHTQGPAWSARTSTINDVFVAHYLARYERSRDPADFDRAFALLQQVRSRNLREVRAANELDQERRAGARSTREVERANQALIGALLLEQSSESLARNLAKAEEQYQRDVKTTPVVRVAVDTLSSAAIRSRLDAGTQVRVLFAGASGSHSLLLTRDSVSAQPLPSEPVLRSMIDASVQELAQRGSDLSRTRQLAQVLFPVQTGMPAPKRMLIEADGIFSLVPFSILLDLQAGDRAAAMTRVPSLSALFGSAAAAQALAQPARARKDLVIFADPAFSLAAAKAEASEWRSGYARLPYSRVEAKAIAAYYDPKTVLTFADKDATIGNITASAARTARVLHIAAHGFGSPIDPFVVGLGLAKDSNNSGSGLLTTQHISTVRYQNELIVVSACESGRGQLLDGEGLMSVARSFLASGAKATLSTLWPVPDRANADFMKAFYFALTQTRSDPAAALLYARQTMKRDRVFNHPYYWGGFVLHVVDGSYRPVVAPQLAATQKS